MKTCNEKLVLEPNIPDGDAFYDELLLAHDGLSLDESHALNARLILVLCNHIGNRAILHEALVAARSAVPPGSEAPGKEPPGKQRSGDPPTR